VYAAGNDSSGAVVIMTIDTQVTPVGGHSVPVLTVTLERIADLRESFTLCLAVLVGVNLQGDRQPGVAEDDLRVLGRGS
jgi:hypothetical protein